MSFEIDGFLSEDCDRWKSMWVRQNAPWFEFSRLLNRSIQKLGLQSLTTDETEHSFEKVLISASLYVRSLTVFQASWLMLERGLIVEAKILLRSLLEKCVLHFSLEF